MNRDDFEARVLDLWMKTRIPLTKAHLQYDTSLRRGQLEKWLDELVIEGVLDFDVGDGGEMLWSVPGASRAPNGPATFAELEGKKQRKRRVLSDADKGGDELILAHKALKLVKKKQNELDQQKGDGKKSLLVSTGLSFLGPIGWLYAAPFRESIPALLAFLVVLQFLPTFVLAPLLPLSAIAGFVYGWQYNRYGERTPIFLGDGDDKKKS